MNAVRYFRGLAPVRRRRWDRIVVTIALLVLVLLTVLAALQQFA